MAIEEEPEMGVPEWVVTFGDMMSLLLTFFIMLVSLSEIKEEEKFQAMVDSLQKQFGYEASMKSMAPGQSKPRNSSYSKIASAGRAKRKDIMRGGDRTIAPLGDNPPDPLVVSPGTRETIGGTISFEEDSAELLDSAIRGLDQIVEILKGKPQKIIVGGYTSRKPIDPKSGFTDSMDLAYQRCRSTRQFLIDQGRIDERRIVLEVIGPYDTVPESVKSGRLQPNSRVMVYLTDDTVSQTPGISPK